MNSAQRLLNEFAEFIKLRHSATLYSYAGYTGSAGALLLKAKDSDLRVAIRPWLRNKPVGLQDIMASNQRYRSFRGQSPSIYVHVAAGFRDIAKRHAAQGGTFALVSFEHRKRRIEITGSGNLPKTVLDAFLGFAEQNQLSVAYDFVGTLQHQGGRGNAPRAERVLQQVVNPKLFISYSWDSDSHRRWVLKLAADLIRNGVKVLVDEWDLSEYGGDLNVFMEAGVRECDYVLLVCTPQYAKRANARTGGVGAESSIITGEFYDPSKAGKFLPIVRAERVALRDSLPSYLKSRLAIDFSKDTEYQTRLEELLRRLFSRPRFRRPLLGPIPDLDAETI